MKKLNQMLALAGIAAALVLTTSSAMAQGGGNFDPAEFQQRQMDRYREQLEFTSDDEWNAVKPLVEKVAAAQREVQALNAGRGGGRGGRGGRGDGGGQGGQGGPAGDGGGRRGGFGEPAAEITALRAALESNSADQIKAALGKLREARKTKAAAFAKAQDDLKKVLNAKREATAVMMGLVE